MDFITKLPVSTNWKSETNDSILVIVNRLTKMVYYKVIKITINSWGLVEVIIKAILRQNGLLDSIVSDHGSVFILKFWFSLCYFFKIKQKLSMAFHPQTNGQIKRQNSIIEAYLQAFGNYKQDNWAQLLPIAEFAYNNAKNVSIGHTPFKLNCGYYLRASCKKDVDF